MATAQLERRLQELRIDSRIKGNLPKVERLKEEVHKTINLGLTSLRKKVSPYVSGLAVQEENVEPVLDAIVIIEDSEPGKREFVRVRGSPPDKSEYSHAIDHIDVAYVCETKHTSPSKPSRYWGLRKASPGKTTFKYEGVLFHVSGINPYGLVNVIDDDGAGRAYSPMDASRIAGGRNVAEWNSEVRSMLATHGYGVSPADPNDWHEDNNFIGAIFDLAETDLKMDNPVGNLEGRNYRGEWTFTAFGDVESTLENRRSIQGLTSNVFTEALVAEILKGNEGVYQRTLESLQRVHKLFDERQGFLTALVDSIHSVCGNALPRFREIDRNIGRNTRY